GTEPTTVAKAVEAATELGQAASPQLLEALQAAAGERNGTINARKLGRYLVRNARRIEDNLRFEDGGEDPMTHRKKVRVHGVTGVIGVSANPSREIVSSGVRSGINTGNASNAVCRSCD